MTTATAPAATSEQLIDALAAIHAAASTFDVIHEADSPAGQFFHELELRLREEIFGQGPAEGDEWTHDPLEVAINARSYRFEAEALERVEEHEPLGERIRILRAMGPRVRTLGSTAVMFSEFLECDSCQRSVGAHDDGSGWRAIYDKSRDWDTILCPDCAAKGGVDDAR